MRSLTRTLLSAAAACLIAGATVAPAGAAVRHIRIAHLPRPPLRTIEIGPTTPPETGNGQVPEAKCVTINCPQDGPQAALRCRGCPAQPQGVTIVKIGL
jgi:hypothetical protein